MSLLYAGSNITRLGLLKVVFQELREFASRNRALFYTELFKSYLCEFPISHVGSDVFSICFQDDEKPIWISRPVLQLGAAAKFLSHEIERSRVRAAGNFSGFAWSELKSRDLVTMISESRFNAVIVSEAKQKNSLIPIVSHSLGESMIVNGEYVVYEGSVIFSNSNIHPEKSSWPSELPFEVTPNRKIALLGAEKTSDESKDYLFVGSATNWFHFLIEVLPIYLNLGETQYKGKTAIISAGHPKQIKDIIFDLTGNVPMEVSHGEYLIVSNLTVVTENRYEGGFNFTARTKDFRMLQDYFQKFLPTNSEAPSPFIHVARPHNSYRTCVNSHEIRNLLHSENFLSIEPSLLSFTDQISFFSSAQVIVAESGAAITNLIFANSKAKFVEIRPPNVEDFWGQFSNVLGIKSLCVQGKSHWNPIIRALRSGYSVNLSDLSQTLQEAKTYNRTSTDL